MNALTHDFENESVRTDHPDPADGMFGNWLVGWSIKRRLRLAVFSLTLIPFSATLLMLIFFAYFGKAGADHADRVQAEIQIAQSGHMMAQVSYNVQIAKVERDQALLEAAKQEAKRASASLEGAISLARGRYPEEILAEMVESQRTLELGSKELAELNIADSKGKFEAVHEDLAKQSLGLGQLFDDAHAHAKQAINELLKKIAITFAGSLVFAALLAASAFLGARKIVANIVDMIAQMKWAMEALAKGETHVSIPGTGRNDELGAMARALGVFRQSTLDLQDVTRGRAHAAEEALEQAKTAEHLRNSKAEALRRLADDFEASILASTRFVAEASGQLQNTSSEMATLADQSSDHVSSAAKSMEQAALGVSATASASDQFALSIDEISKQAAASAVLARGVKSSVQEANGNIEGLSRSVDQIGEITEMIGSIAARTNLLSLNASIEAARGGEAGRGFAVVATEVKELAGRTADATRNVAEMIETIRETTGGSVDGLANVSMQIANLEQSAVSIAAAVDEQSVSGRALASSIDDVASNTGEVSQTLGEVRQSSLAAGSAAVQMLKSSEDTQAHAEELKAQALSFLKEVRDGYEGKGPAGLGADA